MRSSCGVDDRSGESGPLPIEGVRSGRQVITAATYRGYLDAKHYIWEPLGLPRSEINA